MSFDKAIRGYSHVFKKDPTAQANVMVLDAATPGRLSICYYDEFSGVDFIDRIEKWHTYGRWLSINMMKLIMRHFAIMVCRRLSFLSRLPWGKS